MGKKVLYIFIFVFGIQVQILLAQNYTIPENTLQLNHYLPNEFAETEVKIHVNGFSISSFITLKEYKDFLNDIKKDSSQAYYLSLLPDSSFTTKDLYEKYFNTTDYDTYPVVGVSWDNALNYCRWKTVKENPEGKINFVYRLPNFYEWVWAQDYLSAIAESDFNKLYSDWVMDVKDESRFDTETREFSLFYYYFHEKSDPPALKRKLVLGNSFLYAFNSLQNFLIPSYYADHGYRQISFRIVKDESPEMLNRKMTYGPHDEEIYAYDNPLLEYWNLTYPSE